MKSFPVKFFTIVAALGLCSTAGADYREVWTCTVKEGKTMDDVRAANSRWVRYMTAKVDKGISSHIITNVVGGNASTGTFGYVDSFPSLEVWTATKSATEGDEEGEAIDAELGEVAECTENALYEAEKS